MAFHKEQKINKTQQVNFDSIEFVNDNTYLHDDLGVTYTSQFSVFKVWAPTVLDVSVRLYDSGEGGNCTQIIPMKRCENGVWSLKLEGDYCGVYYTYWIHHSNQQECEVVDLYAKAVGVNGNRGMILDLASTNPEGFEKDLRPELKQATDAIVYELHIRDFSIEKESNSKYPGKYLAFTESGTKSSDGYSTLVDYIKGLGVTHVQLLPSFDYASVDEAKNPQTQYNWGYDPKNYNVPEGSYATNPYDGAVRIREYKQMIQALHQNGLRVVMDVVYNHTYTTEDSFFNLTVPDYYYRKNGTEFSDASACGNEVASNRNMVRKYMVDSVTYWAKEYHIDGFRFDLMGIHDLETMKAIRHSLDEIDPSILMYGEGWTGGPSTLDESLRAMKCNMEQLPGIGAFCDDLRDAVKGSVFEASEKGFANGASNLIDSIRFGIVAATNHPQVNYSKVNYSNKPWAIEPEQCINYVSAHDNLTLWDKLCSTNPNDSYEQRVACNKLGAAIVLTSQGIPFFQAGEEMLRTKPLEGCPGEFDENSYVSPDTTNSIKWSNLSHVQDVINYYQGLIEFRKAHSCLHFATTREIRENLTFLPCELENVILYTIKESDDSTICVIFNANEKEVELNLPESGWDVYIDEMTAGTESLNHITSNQVTVAPVSAKVLIHSTKSS